MSIIFFEGISGAGFQLFTQANGAQGVYANAAARDVYFGANPADLARLDANEFLIIKLLDDGLGAVAYQQRSGGAWLDVTSLVQGEDGDQGLDGDITGPVSVTDNTMAVWDGTTGALIKEVPVEVDVNGRMTFTALNNLKNSMLPVNSIEVFVGSDIDDLAVVGVITISVNTFFILMDSVTISSRFVIENGASLHITALGGTANLTYSGVDTFISGEGTFRNSGFADIISTSGSATFLDLIGGIFNMTNSQLTGWDDLGAFSDGWFFARFTGVIDWNTGFKLKDIKVITVLGAGTITNPVSDVLYRVANTVHEIAAFEFLGIPGEINPASSLVRIDPAILDGNRVTIANSSLVGGALFDDSGVDGTFTLVVDASLGATVASAVSGTNAVLRINHGGPAVFVGQQVILSTFIINTAYNGTFIVTAVGAGFFEIKSIPFGTAETGSFLSNSVTLTDIGTALVDGDTVTIDTDFATDYDGGSPVYNQLTDSFQINRAFTVTKTGSWSTRGLTQKNPQILTSSNSNFSDSQAIAFGKMNGNINPTTIADGSYLPVDVTGIAEDPITERFKLIDPVLGIFEFIGNEDSSSVHDITIFAVKTGTIANYRFAVSFNGVIPVFATAGYTPMEVKTTKVQITMIIATVLKKGDTAQVMVAGEGTTDPLTITDIVISG